MKFEKSTFEERYNKYWNDCVVKTDKNIRKQLAGIGFFQVGPDIEGLVTEYQQHVLNIISNLQRQQKSVPFEDSVYVEDYFKATKEQALTDLREYKKAIGVVTMLTVSLDLFISSVEGSEMRAGKQEAMVF